MASIGAAAGLAVAGGAGAVDVSPARTPKRILALAGSPRKGGNTDTLIDTLLDAAREGGAATEKIYLIDKQIAPCRKCDFCHAGTWRACRIKDDFIPVVESMMKADVIVLATPIWWSSMHSLLKLLLDRCYSLVSGDWSQCRLAGKGFVLVACQGQKDLDLYVNRLVREFTVYEADLKIKVVSSLVASAYEKGEVAANKDIMGRAARLGRSLATA